MELLGIVDTTSPIWKELSGAWPALLNANVPEAGTGLLSIEASMWVSAMTGDVDVALALPAESRPNIRIRTSWSLLHRTSDDKEENSVENDKPIVNERRQTRER